MEDETLEAVRKRILAPFQAQRGVPVWAPWGASGWSAVVILKPSHKWAKGLRVKPATGKEVSEGKVPLDQLIKRDQSLKGKDRPGFAPSEVFAHREPAEAEAEPEKIPEPVVEEPKPKPKKKMSEAGSLKRAKKIFGLIGNGSFNDDDW